LALALEVGVAEVARLNEGPAEAPGVRVDHRVAVAFAAVPAAASAVLTHAQTLARIHIDPGAGAARAARTTRARRAARTAGAARGPGRARGTRTRAGARARRGARARVLASRVPGRVVGAPHEAEQNGNREPTHDNPPGTTSRKRCRQTAP